METQVLSTSLNVSPPDSLHRSPLKTAGLFARPVLSSVRHAVCAMLIAAAPCAIAADGSLLENGNAAEGLSGWAGFKKVVPDPEGGADNCFVLYPELFATSSALIPVDPQKTYVLGASFRAEEDGEVRAYLGVDCYDADMVQIQSGEVTVNDGTETNLTADAAVGDKVLKVTDASEWKADDEGHPYGRVAFNVDDSGHLKDLPNRDLSGSGIPVVRQAGDGWEVELTHPLEKAYPKGAKIRQHRDYGRFCYIQDVQNIPLTIQWEPKSGELSGTSDSGTSGHQFWPGTRSIRVAVVNSFSPEARAKGDKLVPMLVRDLSFSEKR